ncbi:MAG: hypothetical protein LBG67_03210 [Campylobacteraceae bacterium]|jgi:transcriptional repressor NrdR|nr:hypothetical protein [Campylobacteraceae bacterium]
MICPKCAGKTAVKCKINGTVNNRYRTCLECGHKFQTVEAIQFDNYWSEYAKETYEANKKEFVSEQKKER